MLAVGFFIILAAVARSIGAPYSAWANNHIEVCTSLHWMLCITVFGAGEDVEWIWEFCLEARARSRLARRHA